MRAPRPRPPGRPGTATGRRGQALVEFALVLPFLVLMLFGTIEASRMMNLYLALQDVARRSALVGAAADPTLSRKSEEVARATLSLLQNTREIRFSIHGSWADQPPSDEILVDLNYEEDGQYYTKVSLTLTMGFLLLPGGERGGIIPVSATGLALNETQGKRRDADRVYGEERFQLIRLVGNRDRREAP